MRNNCSALSKIAGICLSGYAINSILCYLSPAVLVPRFGGYVLIVSVGFAIAAFFIPKQRFISFPVWVYSLSICVQSIVVFCVACAVHTIYTIDAWDWVISSLWLAFSIASLTLMSVIFAKTKPFRKDGQDSPLMDKKRKEPAEIELPAIDTRPISLDEIARAKELLDAGAITPEEFCELKRRAFH